MASTAGFDISHFQGKPNFTAVRNAGFQFGIHKITESSNYADPNMPVNRQGIKNAGMVFGGYHFARGGNIQAEADWFVREMNIQVGEFVVLDWEIAHADPVGWSIAWLRRVRDTTGVNPFIYMNQSAMNGSNWQPVVDEGFPLWLAKYDYAATAPTTKYWPYAAMKQYTDRGTVPGISGNVDVDVFYGTVDQLLKYCKQGATPPPQPPTPPTPPNPPPGFNVINWRVSAGQSDPHIPNLREWGNRMYPGYGSTPMSTDRSITSYGPQLVAFIKEFGSHVGVPNDGKDIGPKIAAALYKQGFRG